MHIIVLYSFCAKLRLEGKVARGSRAGERADARDWTAPAGPGAREIFSENRTVTAINLRARLARPDGAEGRSTAASARAGAVTDARDL